MESKELKSRYKETLKDLATRLKTEVIFGNEPMPSKNYVYDPICTMTIGDIDVEIAEDKNAKPGKRYTVYERETQGWLETFYRTTYTDDLSEAVRDFTYMAQTQGIDIASIEIEEYLKENSLTKQFEAAGLRVEKFASVEELERYIEDEGLPRISQAPGLPDGWEWYDYKDRSGGLIMPDGTTYMKYDCMTSEYCYAGKLWGKFVGYPHNTESLSSVKERVENHAIEELSREKERLKKNLTDRSASVYKPIRTFRIGEYDIKIVEHKEARPGKRYRVTERFNEILYTDDILEAEKVFLQIQKKATEKSQKEVVQGVIIKPSGEAYIHSFNKNEYGFNHFDGMTDFIYPAKLDFKYRLIIDGSGYPKNLPFNEVGSNLYNLSGCPILGDVMLVRVENDEITGLKDGDIKYLSEKLELDIKKMDYDSILKEGALFYSEDIAKMIQTSTERLEKLGSFFSTDKDGDYSDMSDLKQKINELKEELSVSVDRTKPNCEILSVSPGGKEFEMKLGWLKKEDIIKDLEAGRMKYLGLSESAQAQKLAHNQFPFNVMKRW